MPNALSSQDRHHAGIAMSLKANITKHQEMLHLDYLQYVHILLNCFIAI